MDNILDKAYDIETFRKKGHALIDMMADYLSEATSDRAEIQAIPWQSPKEQLDYWQKDFRKPNLADPLDLFERVMDRSIQVHRKRYLGHQTTPTLPVTVLSAALTALLNQGMGVYEMGMVGNTLEKVLTEHLAQKLGFGRETSGFITSGGSLGNLTALLAARAAATDIWHNGYEDGQQLAVLVSEEAHYCIDRSARIMGLGAAGIIKVPVNEKFQMRTELLEQYYQQALSEGKQVVSVIGCAGSTSTGSYDDLRAIAAFSRKYNIWFHVDGAHGAPAAFSPKYRHLVAGIEEADSVVVDYHKMMMTPSLSTAVLFKSGGDAYKTFSQRAQYLWTDQNTEEWYNGGKRTFECTKAMSALNVYTISRTYGDEVFKENIERLYGLAERFADMIRANENLELAYEPQCNIVCFRFTAAEGDLSKLNLAIRKALLEEGRFYIVQTVLNGELYLRVSLMNPLSTEKELQELLLTIEENASGVLQL
ncbi:aminotransferase class I/II-fold pyridoxal phosphate-dependent enzyme [Pontibacter diazotrophicus]|uniref:Aminotransferase class I/II-fold pyridoxal phosphate-dependent enzyme n=1 Tax=Pontibacter diazotrophicus TaxID=1400979 RepID=A0A3D8L1R1_9BACT|nr:aminotransferase class I/II-fold pyridoxal phosphate-dependent enzyme [Pontibacter diazotrophicus]RDV11303.1 aminotransferase class I/II-fold pyridoxal phosphate-dependent enzyme [Pontibacter diazotrophicus]